MSFVSTELKFCGFRYGGTIYTVQDLECDPTGHIIYAEGTIKSFRLTGVCRRRKLDFFSLEE